MSKNLKLALVCLTLLILITLISALPIGVQVREETINSIQESELNAQTKSAFSPVLHKLTIRNSFLPRQYVLPRGLACLYSSKTGTSMQLDTSWTNSDKSNQQNIMRFDNENTVELGIETKKMELVVNQARYPKYDLYEYEARPTPPPNFQNDPNWIPPPTKAELKYDSIYLFLDKDEAFEDYKGCYNLQPADLTQGKKIQLI